MPKCGLGGQCQGLDLGRQAALITSSLVLVEDALVSHGVQHGLRLGEQFSSLHLVAGNNGLLNVLDSSTVLRTQRCVCSVQSDVLASALAAGGQAGVLFDFSSHDVF